MTRAGLRAVAALAGMAAGAPALAQQEPLAERGCPAGLAATATCYSGRDAQGAWLIAAIPKAWNRVLVVHAHGGPRLGAPQRDDPEEDLLRFGGMVRQGYAWIGTTYRRGGYGVRMAAEDVESARTAFWKRFGKPRYTLLHGQSYGGNVAAKAAELHGVGSDGDRRYDGVLITNGVLFGGTGAYGFRADLRAVYQYFCNNLPRPDEPQYPLWQGLPGDSALTRGEVARRLNACTGADLDPGKRSAEQRRRLAAIVGVSGIAAENLARHLEWATFTFRDLILRLDGRNPFDNARTVYRGSGDDAALNKGVVRFAADQAAVDSLSYDADLTGLIIAPTITVHFRDDPVVSSTADDAYAAKVAAAGKAHLLLQFKAAKGTHSELSQPDYLGPLNSLMAWVESGRRPTSASVIERCRSAAGECTLVP